MSSLEMTFKDPIHIIIYLITLVAISSKLTIFVVILFPITGIIIGIIGKSLKNHQKKDKIKWGIYFLLLMKTYQG